jgi:hypothetical protein
MHSVYREPLYWPDLFCTDQSVCSSIEIPSMRLSDNLLTKNDKMRSRGNAWFRPATRTRVTHIRAKPDLSLSVSGFSSQRSFSVPPSRDMQAFPRFPALSRPGTESKPVRRQLIESPRGAPSLRIINIRAYNSDSLFRVYSPTVARDRTVRHLLVSPFM